VPAAGAAAIVRTTVLDVHDVPVACHPGHRRRDVQVTSVTARRLSVSRVTDACERWQKRAAGADRLPEVRSRACSPVLAPFPLNPVLPARDGARAEAFYRDVLGLDQLSPPGMDPMAFAAGNGSMVVLTELPDRTPPPYPVVAFLVEGIERLVSTLAERGVEFVDPRPASFAGTEGVIAGSIIDFGAVKSTWLRDSEGNILALNELTPAAGAEA
jgi:catechol 2,3-dioxygenase-like lactoylglutathione lyase family enzyme